MLAHCGHLFLLLPINLSFMLRLSCKLERGAFAMWCVAASWYDLFGKDSSISRIEQ